MINVEVEVSKHKNVKDRGVLVMLINEYKGLALQFSGDIVLAGQYNMVALKLQELCDKLPAPQLRKIPTGGHSAPTKTAKITKEEKVKIENAWDKKAHRK